MSSHTNSCSSEVFLALLVWSALVFISCLELRRVQKKDQARVPIRYHWTFFQAVIGVLSQGFVPPRSKIQHWTLHQAIVVHEGQAMDEWVAHWVPHNVKEQGVLLWVAV